MKKFLAAVKITTMSLWLLASVIQASHAGVALSSDYTHIEHTHSLPLDIFSTCDNVVLVSPFKQDTCCGQVLTFENGLAVLDLQKCSKYISCKNSPDFRKEIIETSCKTGFHMSGGCVKTPNTRLSQTGKFTTTCFCTEYGLQCSDKLHIISCGDMEPYVVDSNDNLLIINGASNKTLTIKMEVVELPLIPELSEGPKIEFVNCKVSNGKVAIELKNALNVECQVFIDKNPCKFLCKTSDCAHACSIPERNDRTTQMKVKIMCGDLMRTAWLFRPRKESFSSITGHGGWRTHSKLIGILLVLDIAFGYILFRLLAGVSYYLYNLLCAVFSVFNKSFYKYVLGYPIHSSGHCSICKTPLQNVYDAFLHDRYCAEGVCPYCKEAVDLDTWHITNCESRQRSIAYIKSEKKMEIEERVKEITKDLKVEIWKNKLTMKKIPSRLWYASLGLLIFFLIISPASTLMNKPCTRLVGRTAKCSSKLDSDSLGNDVDEHNYWSQVELGMLTKLEEMHVKDEFLTNAVHRMKTNYIHMQGNSAESIELQGTKCKSNGVCKAITEVKWVSDAFKGNIQMYETAEKSYHRSTMNLFLADVEVVFPLFKEYSTADWIIDVHSKFSCTDSDCDKFCDTDFNKNKCLVKKDKRPKDTSWAHNPVWCWSINSGCTCMEAFIKQKHDGNFFNVYKTGDGIMRGLLCMEYNSIFINCIIVDRSGTYEMGRNRVQINKWFTNAKPPKRVITEISSGSTTNYTQAKTGPSCEKENCNAGDAGDWQFDNLTSGCTKGMYFNSNGLSSALMYEFAHSPEWEMTYPKYGSARYNKYPWVTSEDSDHHVDLEKNSLVFTEGNFGSFSIDLTVTDMEIFEIVDNSEITSFEVKRCVGEYMSSKGSICTFLVNMQGTDRTNIRIVSNDDSTFIQNDMQMITSGQNGFRKFMYVRNKRSSYSFCVEHKMTLKCDSIKYNLSEPSHNWSISPSSSSYGKNKDFIQKCDMWFGLSCMINRFLDFFKTMWSALWILMIGLALYIGVKFLTNTLFKKYKKDDEVIPLTHKQADNLNNSIKLMMARHRS